MNRSDILEQLYQKYDIPNLTFGKIHDKLGDVYEEYCITILTNPAHLKSAQQESESQTIEFKIFKDLMQAYSITDFSLIKKIDATNKIPHRYTHGLSKTDVIVTIYFSDGTSKQYAISCKQSTKNRVAFAEFDVDTICREIGIDNDRLKELMLKHQIDKSAKYFSADEKIELRNLLAPIVKKFVRWVLTGSPEENPKELIYPTSIIKFKVKAPKNRYDINVASGNFDLISVSVSLIEDYINSVIYMPNGKQRTGGFGTGLSWTYATGSGGFKIQFKA